jgi:hypothetical protein
MQIDSRQIEEKKNFKEHVIAGTRLHHEAGAFFVLLFPPVQNKVGTNSNCKKGAKHQKNDCVHTVSSVRCLISLPQGCLPPRKKKVPENTAIFGHL